MMYELYELFATLGKWRTSELDTYMKWLLFLCEFKSWWVYIVSVKTTRATCWDPDIKQTNKQTNKQMNKWTAKLKGKTWDPQSKVIRTVQPHSPRCCRAMCRDTQWPRWASGLPVQGTSVTAASEGLEGSQDTAATSWKGRHFLTHFLITEEPVGEKSDVFWGAMRGNWGTAETGVSYT